MNKYAEFSKHKTDISNRRCLTKAVYRSEEKAELASAYIYAKLGERQTPYHCPMCLKWHLTSKQQDFHDDRPDDKAERGSWSNWRNEQQREFTSGLGRR